MNPRNWQVNGANQTGPTLRVKGTPGTEIWPSEWFSIMSLNVRNPVNHSIMDMPPIFVATGYCKLDENGYGEVGINPAIIPDGPYANIERAPDDRALIMFPGEPCQ